MKQSQTFADRLTEAMGKTHTGRAIADALGIREETVSGWKNGKSPPGEERMTELARLLAVTPQWLRYGTNLPSGQPTEPAKISSVNITVSETETVVAVRAEHEKYSHDQHQQSWQFAMRIADIVAAGMHRAFKGAMPAPLVVRVNAEGKAIPPRLDRTDDGRLADEHVAAEAMTKSAGKRSAHQRKAGGQR